MQSLQSLQTLTNLLKICRLYVSCAFCDISVLKGFVVNNQVFDITLQLCNCKVGLVGLTLQTLWMYGVKVAVFFGIGCLKVAVG